MTSTIIGLAIPVLIDGTSVEPELMNGIVVAVAVVLHAMIVGVRLDVAFLVGQDGGVEMEIELRLPKTDVSFQIIVATANIIMIEFVTLCQIGITMSLQEWNEKFLLTHTEIWSAQYMEVIICNCHVCHSKQMLPLMDKLLNHRHTPLVVEPMLIWRLMETLTVNFIDLVQLHIQEKSPIHGGELIFQGNTQ